MITIWVDTLNEEDIWQYRYPTDAELIQLVFVNLSRQLRSLGFKSQHELMIKI